MYPKFAAVDAYAFAIFRTAHMMFTALIVINTPPAGVDFPILRRDYTVFFYLLAYCGRIFAQGLGYRRKTVSLDKFLLNKNSVG